MQITIQQLKDIISPVKYTEEHIKAIVDALNLTFIKYNINTSLRICHFLAQVLHESGCFRYSVEIWGNTDAQKGYDTRTDLGNSPELDNDGYKYRGRGWLQTTGLSNYKSASKEFNQDFVNNPDLVSQEPWDGLVSGFYWSKRKINLKADLDDIKACTKLVNGGYTHLEQRLMWLQKCKSIIK